MVRSVSFPLFPKHSLFDRISPVWRYVFSPEDRIMGYYKNSSGEKLSIELLSCTHKFIIVIATLSGAGDPTLRTFNAISGEVVLEKKVHSSAARAFIEPLHIGTDVIFSPSSSDLYVLTDGYAVSVLDGETGEFKWRWDSPDQG